MRQFFLWGVSKHSSSTVQQPVQSPFLALLEGWHFRIIKLSKASKNSNMEWNDRAYVLNKVKRNVWALKDASEDLKADRKIVMEAVKNYGLALGFASEDLKKDREIVLAAVKTYGWYFTWLL